jgi:hypothetical protein
MMPMDVSTNREERNEIVPARVFMVKDEENVKGPEGASMVKPESRKRGKKKSDQWIDASNHPPPISPFHPKPKGPASRGTTKRTL